MDARISGDPDLPTATIVLTLDAEADRTMYVDRAANTTLTAADIPDDVWDDVTWLHLTGYSFFDDGVRPVVLDLVAEARRRTIGVSIDPSSLGFLEAAGRETVLDWLAGADLVFPNEDEQGFLALDGDRVVLTRGAAGATFRGEQIAALPGRGRRHHRCGRRLLRRVSQRVDDQRRRRVSVGRRRPYGGHVRGGPWSAARLVQRRLDLSQAGGNLIQPAAGQRRGEMCLQLLFEHPDPGGDQSLTCGRELDDRRALADLSGLPPLLVQVGSYEVLLDDAVLLAAAAGRDDVEVVLQVEPCLTHIFQRSRLWFRRQIARCGGRASSCASASVKAGDRGGGPRASP